MKTYDKEKWIYENDTNNGIRYILGTKGENSLLCFGINPSTAAPDDLDPTLKALNKLSKNNGYDSWTMMNLYPQRATDPNDIHDKIDTEIHKTNLKFVEQILSNDNPTICAAWGTNIEKRPYLKECLRDIISLSEKYNVRWVCFAETVNGHPHHPLYLAADSKIKPFDINKYMSQI